MSLQSFLLTILVTIMLTMQSKALIYDYLVLTLQWPPALCRAQPCTKYAKPRFHAHGLWPNVFPGPPDPSNCGRDIFHVNFDKNVVSQPALKSLLDNTWPNYLGGNEGFWRYEWEKHGSCAYEVFDQTQYFSHVAGLVIAVNVDSLLNMEGITADFNKDYNLIAFKDAITRRLGNFRPELVCTGGVNGRPLEIQEIRICYNDLGTQFINCSRADSSCGTSTIKWY
ncbi:hypothetical protein TSUD_257390 [Trifolium subterraneum]|uniref:Uncharacterized protein n=1 Tax=Trifolium subterraneum TaxID=3900 RepID=A0A2Z6MXG9_TRISU|nr:hypothetical protein TSUD_257390 [Trifolium subterraneum]